MTTAELAEDIQEPVQKVRASLKALHSLNLCKRVKYSIHSGIMVNPEIINNGVNGYCSNDEFSLRSCIENLLQDDELRIKMGNEARKTILEKFSETNFINNWNNVFERAYGLKK